MSSISKIRETLKLSYLKKCELHKFGRHIFLGLVTILGGLLVYSTLSIIVGYTPISASHTPVWFMHEEGLLIVEKLNALFGFLMVMSYYIFIELVLVYVVVRFLTILTESRAALIIISGAINFAFVAMIVLGVGIMASLDHISSLLTIFLGLFFGLFIVPYIFKVERE